MQDISLVRNVAIFGHGKCGKTSLAEALLFTAGKTTRLGKVDDGSSVMDFEPEEIRHHMTISSSFNQCSWNKHAVYLIDTPGDDNFLNESKFAAAIADTAIFVIEATGDIKSQTEKIAGFVTGHHLPTVIIVNRMDRERADFTAALAEATSALPFKIAATHLPIGAENNFRGIIDIVRQKACIFTGETGKCNEEPIPAEMAGQVAKARETLMEMVAETDDELIEKFLEEGELTGQELLGGLKKALRTGALAVAVPMAATKNHGSAILLDLICDFLPNPSEHAATIGTDPRTGQAVERLPLPSQPFSAQVFKTMADPYAGHLSIFKVISGTLTGDSFYNASTDTHEKFGQLLVMEGKNLAPIDGAEPGMIVAVAKLKATATGDTLCDASAPVLFARLVPVDSAISYAVNTTQKKDEEKLHASIHKMLEEDPTLQLIRDPLTRQILVSGVGQVHLEIISERLKRKFGVEMELELPQIPYRETIKGKARVQGKHKKQTGGHGQFADCWIEIEPLRRGEGFVFEDKIVGGVVPRQFIPAVEKGVIEAMDKGILAGHPVVDFKVALVDGSFHAVDSSEMAFKLAGGLAFRKGVQEANPVLLEPIMNITVRVPKDYVGDVIGDLNGRRGKVLGMATEAKDELIRAQAPMAEIQRYAPDLTSFTGGRGSFKVEFSHYEEVPTHLAEKLIAQASVEQG